jgi:polyisoprenyl-phosphate glycosyltransferase
MDVDFSVVVPVFNEEAVLPTCHERLTAVMAGVPGIYELIFVNDGSRDRTLAILNALRSKDRHVQVIDFSRNFGHQIAISAGLAFARGKAVVVIDADLQDPPEVIPEMISKWREGFEVVYGRRLKREGESAFKKLTSKVYYRFLAGMTDVSIPVDVGDFRLIDRKVCDALNQLKEKHRYVRGLIAWLGFSQSEVTFSRAPRYAGKTKYPLKKMVSFAADGLVSFSSKPLKLATVPGVVMSLLGFVYFIVVLYQKICLHSTQTGWASLMSAILFFNGYTLIVLGIIGEYLGRLFDEAKGRPLYVIRDSFFQNPEA